MRAVKNRLRAFAPPGIFLALTCYFVWNAIHGRSGLEAQVIQRAQIQKAAADFQAAEAKRVFWATRIADLSGQSIHRDMLDEQARQVLNLANPNDLVIDLPPAQSGK